MIPIATWLLAAVLPVHAGDLTQDAAPIQDVLVYPDRAKVTRHADVRLPAGNTSFTLGGLPYPLLEGSIRAEVAAKGARVVGVTQRREVRMEARREEVEQLNRDIRVFETAIRSLAVRHAQTLEALERIDQFRDHAAALASLQLGNAKADTASYERALDLYREQSFALLSDRSEILRKIEEERDALSASKARRNDLQQGRDRATTEVTVTVEAQSAAQADLAISYGVDNASWSPRYELRYDDDVLEFGYLAEVQQASGEAWEDVTLTLTTARPDAMTPPPEPEPLFLQGYKEKQRTVVVQGVREEVLSSEVSVTTPTTGTGELVVTTRGLSVDLGVPEPASIPADGRPYRVTVLDRPLDATLDNWAAVSLVPRPFLRAQTANQTGVPLLPGPVDVFRTSGFVGITHLNHVAVGEKMDLSLGPVSTLTVKRRDVVDRHGDIERALGRAKHTTSYKLVVKNFDNASAQVVLSEALPVSRLGPVKVILADRTTEGFAVSEDGSIHTWTVDVPAQGKAVVEVEYVVDTPADYAL
jgi:uncharacterized protein (TIGR02231 family)